MRVIYRGELQMILLGRGAGAAGRGRRPGRNGVLGLHRVAVGGFGRIEDVLSAAELAAFDQAYRSTTLPDVAALNSRPSLTP